ncbi:MAG: TonB-dependent receptor, partial [Myxococcota bacterium]|nr:TonB-dependent receptor [Myxococcota bacterium]
MSSSFSTWVRASLISGLCAVAPGIWTSAFAQPSDVTSPADPTDDSQADARENDMIVTGTRTPQRRADSPISTEVITREEIENSGATNLGQLMANTAGVQVQRTFAGVGLALQGLDAKHTLVLLDGNRLPGSKDGVFDIERLNLENIERVEILRGAGSALYGADALGGVVNIITRKESRKDHVRSHLQTFLGNDKSSETMGRFSTRQGSVSGTLSGGYHWLPAFRVDSDDRASDNATDGSSIEDWYIRSLGRVDLVKRSRLNAGLEYSKRQRAGVDASESGAVFDRRQVVDMYDAFISFEHKADGGDRFVSSLRYNYLRDQFLMDQRLSDRRDKYEDSRLQYTQGNGQTDLQLPAQNVLSLGVDGIFETADNPRIIRNDDCDFESPSTLCRTADRYRGAVYLQNVWTILSDPYLVLVAGSRLEGDSRFGYVTVPRIALRYDPIDSLTLRTSIGQGYRAPSFKELYLRFDNPSVGYTVRGNDELEPELSMSYQIGADLTLSSFASVYVNLFRNEVEGLIDYDLVTPGTADG